MMKGVRALNVSHGGLFDVITSHLPNATEIISSVTTSKPRWRLTVTGRKASSSHPSQVGNVLLDQKKFKKRKKRAMNRAFKRIR